MAGEKDRVDGHLSTSERLEPEIHWVDALTTSTSAAISLKRIADALETLVERGGAQAASSVETKRSYMP